MNSVKRLPKAVHSSVRSGIIVYDLTRVVEELIFNSLDAGATKVSVAIGVGTCYVKVVDNGSGITRDGLVLLGERYATSKLDELDDMNAATGSFGFRGEALGSISDVSLLEVITKAHGRPNGYRKVMKGCKCLYLGIDDNRQDVGTTVIVRDLFYNQPVRRKHMQSSPKKVLHSVKKCVLRIGLVHSKVSFKVVDIDSEDELLHTCPSSSSLPLLMSGFGIEVSSSLRELNVSDGALKLSGHISGPCDPCPVKTIQYIYINSRYICKGPMHKLLNELAARFNYSDLWNANTGSQNGKRGRCKTTPTYILNLSCPRSCYDLTFEPSKATVEFKDLDPILNFFEKVITDFWSENISHGDPLSDGADMSQKDDMWKEGDSVESGAEANYEIVKKRYRTQNCRASPGLPSPLMMMENEECNYQSAWRDGGFSCRESDRSTSISKDRETEVGFGCLIDYSFQSFDGSLGQHRATINQESGRHLWTSNNVSSAEDYFLESKTFATKTSNEFGDSSLGSRWEDVSLKIDEKMSSGLLGSGLFADYFEISNDAEFIEDLKTPFLQSCSLRRGLLPDGACASDTGLKYQIDGLGTKRKWVDHGARIDIVEAEDSNQNIKPRTIWQDEEASVWASPKPITKCDVHVGSKYLRRDSIKSFSVAGDCFAGQDDIPLDSAVQIKKIGSSWCFDPEWSPGKFESVFGAKLPEVEPLIDNDVFARHFKHDKNSSYSHSVNRELKDCIFTTDSMRNSISQEKCSLPSCMNVSSYLNGYTGSKRDIRELQGHNLDDIFFRKYSHTFADEAEWLSLHSFVKDNTNSSAVYLHHVPSGIDVGECKYRRAPSRQKGRTYGHREKQRRNHSAPPFYRGKKKFFVLKDCLNMEAGKSNFQTIHDAPTLQETSKLKHQETSAGVCHLTSNLSSVDGSYFHTRPDIKSSADTIEVQNSEKKNKGQCRVYSVDTVKDFTSKETEDPLDHGLKWRNSCPQSAVSDKLDNLHNQDTILDISSGILHLAGDSLVPKSISKDCLEDAKVLQQVDKKFIPVVAGKTLAFIDQHAADERIRLEELRQKVLSGEMKTITYLDAEQELVLPEIGHQLLHNYAEQIQNWGWICNVRDQSSRSFRKNLNLLHRQPTVATLVAVPCILGVNLTDVDLSEFLQQLADTDGSSTMPPSVLRVLNFKACRGAIMFGDTLLPSECSLIVEELKRTSLCLQCAHGRPTTVPLVNLELLHKQIAKLGVRGNGSNELWHGLCRHDVSLERAAHRLSSAGGHYQRDQ